MTHFNSQCFLGNVYINKHIHKYFSFGKLQLEKKATNNQNTRIQDCLFTFERTTSSVLLYYDLAIHVLSLFPWTHFLIVSELSFSAI